MTFETIESIFTISMDSTLTLAFAAILLLIGYAVRGKSNFLQKYCIPAPVVGGFLFMLITWAGHSTNSFAFSFENIYQDIFMLAFFTTVGLGASFRLLKQGGKLLIIYWLIAGILAVTQNAIGIAVSKVVGLEAPYALLASAISMVGGHGAAASYGKTFAEMGYEVAPLVGAACATFGLISSVMIGGPLGRTLVEKNNLNPSEAEEVLDESVLKVNESTGKELTSLDIIKNVSVMLICMAIGTVISTKISEMIGMGFPQYVGAMFVAVIARNLTDHFELYNFNYPLMDEIGNVMLNLYLSLSLMTLKLWELADLFGGVLVVLLCQVVFMLIVAYFIVFKLLGKNYDAAVMTVGLVGHGLGATPTAMVNMNTITERYGMSRKAYMIVPIVGAFLVDIVYQPATIWFIKTFVTPL